MFDNLWMRLNILQIAPLKDDYDYCLVWKLGDVISSGDYTLKLVTVLFPPNYAQKLLPFSAAFPLASSSSPSVREMSEYGQVVITGALIFLLQVLKCGENNLHSPPVKV